MAERKISEKSLENLKRFNQENKAITREAIEISLLQLLEKKDLKKITISELVERAGVSRAAFYRNYGSKEEILKSIFESSIAKITKSLDGYNLKTDLYQVWVYLLKEVKKEAKIISLAIDYNFEQVLTKAVYDFLEKHGLREVFGFQFECQPSRLQHSPISPLLRPGESSRVGRALT